MTVTDIGTIYRYRNERKGWGRTSWGHHILSYQLTGHYDHDFGDRILPVHTGCLFFIHRDDAYTVTRRRIGESICVTLDMEDAPPSSVYDCADEPRVENLFHRLYSLRHIEVEETRCSAMAVIYELLGVLASKRTPDGARGGADGRLSAACRYIHTHFREGEIRIASLAADAGLGVKQFTTLFARQYRVTPLQYVIDLRLRTAATLLREGVSVAQAAEAVGFSDVYYFSKMFKRRFSLPPGCYARG